MPPDLVRHHMIERLAVNGGFLNGLELRFADGLNCLIGGRGTGKTTALEFLRYALGLMPDSKTQSRRARNVKALIRSNLGHGRVEAGLITKDGMRYSAGRGFGDDVHVRGEVGNGVPVSLENDLIFGADVFSQSEIEEIATDPSAQLDLLDRFDRAEMSRLQRRLEGLSRRLGESEAVLLRVDEEIENLTARASEVAALQERLKAFAEVPGPDAEKLNKAHALQLSRNRESQFVPGLMTALRTAVGQIGASVAGFRATGHLDGELLRGPNVDVLSTIASEVGRVERVFDSCVDQIRIEADRATLSIGRQRHALIARHANQEAAYREQIAESNAQGGRAAERAVLQTSLANAQAKAKERAAKLQQRAALIDDRQQLLDQQSELRDQRFAVRKRIASELTTKGLNIRVSVSQAADLEDYKTALTGALRGAGLKQGMVAGQLAHAFLPSELSQMVADCATQALQERLGYDAERATRVLSGLRASKKAYALEAIDIEDLPSIELLDGSTYKQSAHLSTGQRCTTILPILLLQSERPLLIDQPEDNLDNAFVFETVVTALHAVRGSRQVIFVTHNPNIPVLGEAERVFVFESNGQHGTVPRSGSVDECKEEIERILEGGREAFLKRKQRYGY